MVTTDTGVRLTEAHRLGQAEIVRQASLAVTVAFRSLLDPADLDTSTPRYVRAATPVVQGYRAQSASLSTAYYRALRQAEGVTSPFSVPALEPVADEAVQTSLLVTGPVAAKSQVAKGLTVDDALTQALASTLGAVGRHVQNGGRETLVGAVSHDRASRGYARISSAHPCHFCAMLVSRGPVYRSQATVAFRSHDSCHCGVAPFFRGSSGWTEQARQYRDLWDASTRTAKGPAEARASFRRAYGQKFGAPAKSVEPPPPPRTGVAALPRKKTQVTPENAAKTLSEDVKAVNPGYGQPGFNVNCVHVVSAMELRRRGLDVTASALPEALRFQSGRDANEALQRWKTPDGSKRYLWPMTKTDVKKEVGSWPPGGRGWVRVGWSRDFGGGGHIWNVEKMPDGSIRWIDGQNASDNMEFDTYARRAKSGRAWSAVRVDDLEPSDDVLEFVNERGAP